MAGLIFERCEPDSIRDIMGKKMPTDWPRMRSKVIKVLDNYYFKEMKGEELHQHIQNAIVVRPDVKNMQ